MSANLKAPIRTAILAATAITDELATYKGAPAVFTRRPIPDDATYPCIVIETDLSRDEDALVALRPVVMADICVYGTNDPQGAEYRAVENIGYALRNLFHRKRWSIVPTDAAVIDVVARGPSAAPTDDEKTVGRVVTLQVRLRDDGA
jgi:hypothetical protein